MRRIIMTRDNRFRVFDRLSLSFVSAELSLDEFVKDFGVQLAFNVSTERELYKKPIYDSPEAIHMLCTVENLIQQGDKSHDQAAFTIRTSDDT